LQGLIDELVRDEVLYREALALGLDRDDVVIRRLLRQKFEFVTQDLAVDPEPAEDVLRAFYDEHAERYTRAAELSFSQIMFSPDRRGPAAEADAAKALEALQTGSGREAADTLGDGGALAPHYDNLADYEIAAIFGPDFAQSVSAQETGRWIGPVASSYGLHLVWIESRVPGAALPFDEVAGQVRDDWTYAQRKKANDAIYRKLLERYDVTVEPLIPAVAEGGS
jgi:parvulin-like peptidyl-prolyl isomerase